MSNFNVPLLKLATIRKATTPHTFRQGEEYCQQERINRPMRQGLRLWAYCYGSQLYRTSVTLEENGAIAQARCTCFEGEGKLCKHQVALLLTYIQQGDHFEDIPPVAELLVNASREETLALLEQMTQRYPDLLTLLVHHATPLFKPGIDPANYRRQVRCLFDEDDNFDLNAIRAGLEASQAAANQAFERSNLDKAGMFYQILLEEMTRRYDQKWLEQDETAQFIEFSQQFAAALGDCLQRGGETLDPKTRQLWLDTLLEGFLKNIELGNVDYAGDAGEYLLELATDTEWNLIQQRVRLEIPLSSVSTQQVLVSLLQERLERRGKEEEAMALAEELGTSAQRAFLSIEEVSALPPYYDAAGEDSEEFPETAESAQQHLRDYRKTMLHFANALIESHDRKSALQLIYERWQGDRYEGYQQWLTKYYQKYGTPEAALEWQESLFLQQPSGEGYEQLAQLAERFGFWQEIRDRVLANLTERQQWQALAEIALVEGESEQAIAHYQRLIEHILTQRDRSAYRQATQHLQQLQQLYQTLNAAADWKDYLHQLRSQYSEIDELQDELNQVGFYG